MRNTLVALLCVLALVTFAQAANLPGVLQLVVDPATGAAVIKNPTAAAVLFDGYTVSSAAGQLNNGAAGWYSFDDAFNANFRLSAGVFGWSELSATVNMMSEGNINKMGTLAADEEIMLGNPVNPGAANLPADLTFEYLNSDTSTDMYNGEVIIPEPATLSVLGLGLLGLLRRRR